MKRCVKEKERSFLKDKRTKRPDQAITKYVASKLQTPGLDNTLLFMGLTASAGTRSMSLLSSSPRNGSSPYNRHYKEKES